MNVNSQLNIKFSVVKYLKDVIPQPLQESWEKFSNRLINFAIRDKKDGDGARNKEKIGFIPCQFIPQHKKQDNAVNHSMLVLDYDKGQTIHQIYHDEVWTEFEHVLYTSFSHQKTGIDKFRIVLPLKTPINDPEIFKRLWFWAEEKSDFKIDTSCKNLDRFYYFPAIQEQGSPSYAKHWSAEFLDWEELDLDKYKETKSKPVVIPQKPTSIKFSACGVAFENPDYSAYLDRIAEQEYQKAASTPKGSGRNPAMNILAHNLGKYEPHGYITEDQAYKIYLQAGYDNGIWNETETNEIDRRFQVGFQAGRRKATVIQPASRRIQVEPEEKESKKDVLLHFSNPVDEEAVEIWTGRQEKGAAKILEIAGRGHKLFDHTAGFWITYGKGLWKKDDIAGTRDKANDLLVPLYQGQIKIMQQEINKKTEEINKQFVNENGLIVDTKGHKEAVGKSVTPIEKRKAKINGIKNGLDLTNKMDNVLTYASGLLPTKTEEFDLDPLIFNLNNGYFDFRQMIFKQHSPETRFYKQAPCDYVKGAKCEEWENFLQTIFRDGANIVDTDLIKFVQQCVGFSLTGLCDMQSLFFCYGGGANGKSTFFQTIFRLMGDYAGNIKTSLLLTSGENQASNEYHLARLHGARLIVGSEIPRAQKLNEAEVKTMTGNDIITARNPCEKPFSFSPTHKIWLFGNHKPEVVGSDEGIWRRIKLIPFLVQIPEKLQRPMSELLEKFKKELPGILNWAIEGYEKYIFEGLVIPDAVRNATEAYKKESNILGPFIEDNFDIPDTDEQKENSFEYLKEIFIRYAGWCEKNKEVQIFKQSQKLAKALEERGFVKTTRGQNKTIFKGFNLVEEKRYELGS